MIAHARGTYSVDGEGDAKDVDEADVPAHVRRPLLVGAPEWSTWRPNRRRRLTHQGSEPECLSEHPGRQGDRIPSILGESETDADSGSARDAA